VFFIRKTILKLEMSDLLDHVICRCRKHLQLACRVGGFIASFSLNVSIVHSPKLIIIIDGNRQTDIGFALGETICFGSLKFITDHFSNLNLSPEGNDSGVVFLGMVQSGSSSLYTIL
jgi:hypothetical protein